MNMRVRAFPDPLANRVVPRLGRGGPVVYGAAAAGAAARELLAGRLLASLAGLAPEWAGSPAWGVLAVAAGPLGRPLLTIGGRVGPSLSFSEAGGLLWGALAGRGQVGVDAAREEDFAPPYPYSRALGREEWDWAWRHCQGRAAAAAALLWAAKEAAVKALGTGFHTLDPLDIEVALSAPAREGLDVAVRVRRRAAVSAWVCPLAEGWLGLALV
jgi:phosphopantetheinyl transferase